MVDHMAIDDGGNPVLVRAQRKSRLVGDPLHIEVTHAAANVDPGDWIALVRERLERESRICGQSRQRLVDVGDDRPEVDASVELQQRDNAALSSVALKVGGELAELFLR